MLSGTFPAMFSAAIHLSSTFWHLSTAAAAAAAS